MCIEYLLFIRFIYLVFFSRKKYFKECINRILHDSDKKYRFEVSSKKIQVIIKNICKEETIKDFLSKNRKIISENMSICVTPS